MSEVFVKPTAAGLLVPYAPEARPHGRRHLHADGELVTDSTWWRRREREGDVSISTTPTKSARAKGSPT